MKEKSKEFERKTPKKPLPRPKNLKVIAGAPDKPLVIGDIEIPCYVLEGETRVLAHTQFQISMSMSSGGGETSSRKLVEFLNKLIKKDSKIEDLAIRAITQIHDPIKFDLPKGGASYGYRATLLVDVCDVVLEARKLGILLTSQLHIAERCEILVRGFSRVGIDALIDEATGYQEQRSKRALADALEKYLGILEKHPWVKTFPLEFYKEIYRLHSWVWIEMADGKKPPTPRLVGKITNDLIYKRLIPGFPRALLDELEKVNPSDKNTGIRKYKHHQWFTVDEGLPLLRERINLVTGMMMASDSWGKFLRRLKKRFPRTGDQDEMWDD